MTLPLTWLPLSISCYTSQDTQLTHTQGQSLSLLLCYTQAARNRPSQLLPSLWQPWWITCPLLPLIKGERGAGHTPGPWHGLISFILSFSLFPAHTYTHAHTHTQLWFKTLRHCTIWKNKWNQCLLLSISQPADIVLIRILLNIFYHSVYWNRNYTFKCQPCKMYEQWLGQLVLCILYTSGHVISIKCCL